MNSVLILIITQIDECVLKVLVTVNPTWVESMLPEIPQRQIYEESPFEQPLQSPNKPPQKQYLNSQQTEQHLLPPQPQQPGEGMAKN